MTQETTTEATRADAEYREGIKFGERYIAAITNPGTIGAQIDRYRSNHEPMARAFCLVLLGELHQQALNEDASRTTASLAR